MSTTLQEGDAAPTFDLPSDGGGQISSASLKGKPYVLYFYPKDDTPGCTKEAIGFTEAYPAFEAAGVEVIGLSKDTVSSHQKFKQKYGLCFPLAADDGGQVVEAFGAWVEKSTYGKTYMGIDRSTFLVDGEGKIRKIWRSVKVPGHVDEVLAAAKAL
ncbi:peroxiredoxin Q/BCP [Arboricoccus pini]|uniref:thioredoxin-dependent peroxiredoxin n=1 Tax=Arboricoccus pini TaxID=1963835 RepID=A0A212R5T6_9PROT|nr:peroxiredoxin [Arboricoccus pini]SNB67271.1 peroxiredoxin Q/BCP [Arboricoccus pini]